jgi:hypothetical protein
MLMRNESKNPREVQLLIANLTSTKSGLRASWGVTSFWQQTD